jgi:hypothetical protein
MMRIKLEKARYIDILATDKITSKELLKNLGYEKYLVPTIKIFNEYKMNELQEIEFPIILKVSNGTGQNIIINSFEELYLKANRINKLLKYKHYKLTGEFVYGKALRKIIVEPFLSHNSFGLDDYKVYCFNGNAKFIQVNYNSLDANARVMLDESLNVIEFPFASGKQSMNKPENLTQIKEMMLIAQDISKHFKFIRVDFYVHNDSILIGELTLHPMAGFMLRNSRKLDEQWGRLLEI